MRRSARFVLLGLLVLVVAAGVVVVTRQARGSAAPCEPASGPTSDSSTSITLTLPPSPRVLIFGDSYTQGAGAVPNRDGFAFLVGPRLGWTVTVDGVGGTGYVAEGPQRAGTYQERLATAPPPGPFDLVVLQGSSNDTRQPLAELRPAVEATVAAFRARYAGAQLLLMGPAALYGTAPATYLAVDDVMRDEAAANSAAYIDPIAEHWFVRGESATLANPHNGHPSNAGYRRMADRFVQNVNRQSVAAPTRCRA